ncbi:IS5 family transposase [Streptomyces sp. Li-HN-5-11]|uniref:IS5 family transposase n=1 Tax=Streptomyces sp. Li-HN-5-11 TaxID=3075432 RepID=UPI0037DA1A4F
MDQDWELLAPLIPRAATGRPRVEDRQVINGMVCKLWTGISWCDLPDRYGPGKTVCTRFRRYALDGWSTRALQQIQARADAAGDSTGWSRSSPPSSVPHQHAAGRGGARGGSDRTKRAITPSAGPAEDRPAKVHLACNSKGRSLAILLTPGRRRDSVCARPPLQRTRVPRTGMGRPRCRPDQVVADKAYGSRGLRSLCRGMGSVAAGVLVVALPCCGSLAAGGLAAVSWLVVAVCGMPVLVACRAGQGLVSRLQW